MREIKFRGKDTIYGTFEYGDLYQQHLTNGDITCAIVQLYNTFDVDPKTVGQYTGLKDKNGTEIYEGDIVKYTRYNFHSEYLKADVIEDIYVVYWNDDMHAFWCRTKFECGGGASGSLVFSDDRAEREEIEVIGNIYDNPEYAYFVSINNKVKQ